MPFEEDKTPKGDTGAESSTPIDEHGERPAGMENSPDSGASPEPRKPVIARLKERRAARREAREAQEPVKRSWQRSILETVIILLIAAVIAVLLQSFVIKAFVIPSESMEPTLKIGDRVMVDRMTFLFRSPRLGDIIVFRHPPEDPGAMNTTNKFLWPLQQIGEILHLAHRQTEVGGDIEPYVKRVIATEGQKVDYDGRKGILKIDGRVIRESYAHYDKNVSPKGGQDFRGTVPPGRLFVMGDNRAHSADSRSWGYVPTRSVIGRAFLIWWPLKHFGKPD